MNEEWKRTLDAFERVWPRVSPQGPPPPPPRPRPGPGKNPPPPPEQEETRRLAELIRMETDALRRYQAMARKTGGNATAALRRLAADSGGILRGLQTEYYLRTGDTLPVPGKPKEAGSLTEALRRAWRAAGEAEQAYREAAGQTRDAGLRELYEDAAERKQKQRRELRALARQMMR